MSLLIFILVLSILIVVHEWGHFWMARRVGVRVEEFALGFGPKLWGWTKDGTEYRICAIPLGGYVKMAGDEQGRREGQPDEFFSKSVGYRALIALMGPVVNYALAFLCFVFVFMLGHVDIEATSRQVPAAIGKVMSGSPAEKSGILSGDVITRIDGKLISNWNDMQETILASNGRQIQMIVLRSGREFMIPVSPEFQKAKDIFGREHAVSRVGVQPAAPDASRPVIIRKYSFLGAVKQAGKELVSVTVKTYVALWEIVTGQRSAKEGMTGLIGIFFVVKFALGVGFSYLLHIVGVISASLAIFNLLPLIPLDGGHLALLGLEKMRGRPLSVKTDEILAKAGFFLIIALAVFVFLIDFERIGLIDKLMKLFGK